MSEDTAFDYSKIDVSKVQAGSINYGTDAQDCAAIAHLYERGAHSTPTEVAVWATMSRVLGNTKSFSLTAGSSLESYIKTPQVAALESINQTKQLSGASSSSTTSSSKVSVDELLEGVGFNNFKAASSGATQFGSTLAKFLKDCIPCSLRLQSFLELNPSVNMLEILEGDLKSKLTNLMAMSDMLRNPGQMTDFCTMLDAFRDICIPDLQRIITMLMAQFLLDIPKLDSPLDLIGQIIGPIFAPIFMAINAMIDQFLQLITAPLDCTVDALRAFTTKVDSGSLAATGSTTTMASSLTDVIKSIETAKSTIETKADFYLSEITGLIGNLNGGDSSYLQASLEKLIRIRQIAFMVALIMGKATGHSVCQKQQGKSPTTSEIDNFFNAFFNPSSPFNYWVDAEGLIHIDEKDKNVTDTLGKPGLPLPNSGNVVQFDGTKTVDPVVSVLTNAVAQNISAPVSVVTPCKFNTTAAMGTQVNKWIEEMNKINA